MSGPVLLSLPDECLANIFSFLHQPFYFSLSCKRVHAITQNLSARANWLETQCWSARFRLHMWLELAARPKLCTPGFLQLLTESRKHVPHAELAQHVLRYDPGCSFTADFDFLPNVRCLYEISKGRAAVVAHALEIARKACREPEHPSFQIFTDAFRAGHLSESRSSCLAERAEYKESHSYLCEKSQNLNGPLFSLPVSSSLLSRPPPPGASHVDDRSPCGIRMLRQTTCISSLPTSSSSPSRSTPAPSCTPTLT